MRFVSWLTCVSVLLSVSRVQAVEPPRLANLSSMACLLVPDKGESALTCWESNGVPARIPFFRHPVSLSTVGDYFCVSDEGRVRCWGYGRFHEEYERPLNRKFSRFANIRQLSVNAYNSSCFVYGEGQIGCVGPYGEGAALYHPPQLGAVSELATGDAYACALQAGGKIACWGSFAERAHGTELGIPFLSKPPTDLVNPRDLQLTHDRIGCVLSKNLLRCWGDTRKANEDERKKELARIEDLGAKIGRPLLHYALVLETYRDSGDRKEEDPGVHGLLATDIDGKTWWVPAKDPKANELTAPGLGQGILVSGDDFGMYVASRDSLGPIEAHCVGCETELDQPYYHRLHVPFPVLPLLEGFVRDSRDHTYQEKARVFSAVQELLPLADDDERWFVLSALRPLIEENDSAFIRENVLPRYQASLIDLPHAELRGFPRTPSLVALSAKLIHSALVSANEDPWRSLVTPLGQLLTTGGDTDRRALVAAYREHAAAFTAAATNTRYAPLVHFIETLIGALAD